MKSITASKQIFFYTVVFMLMLISLPSNVFANWSRVSTKQIHKVVTDNSTKAKFNPTSINAVAAQGITSNGQIISSGQWSTTNTYTPTAAGVSFNLKMHKKNADTLPSSVNTAFSTPASYQSKSRAPNKLDGSLQNNGNLVGSSGSVASQVSLSSTLTYSVFSSIK